MTQSTHIQPQPEQPPAICPVCEAWTMMPYAARHTTPIPGHEALGVMVVGFWLASRGAKESQLCNPHSEMLIRLDVQKHQREEYIRTERERLEAEAAKPKYPSPQHEGIASQLIGRIHQVNAPPPVLNVPPPTTQPLMITADPNSFPCPDCQKPVRAGEVHKCVVEVKTDAPQK
jgi:hypothetical protein